MLVKRAAAGVHDDCCWIPMDSMLASKSLALAMVFSVQLQEHSFAAERGHLRIWIDVAVHPLAPAAPVGVHVDDDHPVSVSGAAQCRLYVVLPSDFSWNRS